MSKDGKWVLNFIGSLIVDFTFAVIGLALVGLWIASLVWLIDSGWPVYVGIPVAALPFAVIWAIKTATGTAFKIERDDEKATAAAEKALRDHPLHGRPS